MLGSNTVTLQIFQQQILQCWYLYAESFSMFIIDDIRCKWYCLILKMTKVFDRKCVGRKSVVWTSVSSTVTQHLPSHATKFIALTCIFFSMSHCPLRALLQLGVKFSLEIGQCVVSDLGWRYLFTNWSPPPFLWWSEHTFLGKNLLMKYEIMWLFFVGS